MFFTLEKVATSLNGQQWPDAKALNTLAGKFELAPANAKGERIRFVTQTEKPRQFEETFEPRAYLRGEVLVRERNWHDLFNAVVWLTFPRAKAAINARHYASLTNQAGARRSPEGDALTIFDEDGMVVLSTDHALLQFLREHRWRELFVARREQVRACMRFLIFGHAMYEKAMAPFVGMTAKCILLNVPSDVLSLRRDQMLAEVDRRVEAFVSDRSNFMRGKSLSPLPVLGVPGWWPANEYESFYADVSYFRSRPDSAASGSSSIS